MIKNGLDLSRFLCQQAQSSGLAKAAIVIIMDNNDVLHKTEYGLTAPVQEKIEENSQERNSENKQS